MGIDVSGALGNISSLSSTNQGLLNSIHAGMDPAELTKIQTQMQQNQEAIQMISTMLKDLHDSNMAIISNMR